MTLFDYTADAYQYVFGIECCVDRDGWVDSFFMNIDDAELKGNEAIEFIENFINKRLCNVKTNYDKSLFDMLRNNAIRWIDTMDLYDILANTFLEWQEPIKRKNVCNAN